MRTLPRPENKIGLDCLVALAIVNVFNKTFSGVQKPYSGLFLENDRRCFKLIWAQVAQKGGIKASGLNFARSYKDIVLKEATKSKIPWDDRYTCAGLAEVLFHFARAVVQLSCLWENEVKGYADEDQKFLNPATIHARAIADLALALGLPDTIVLAVIGDIKDCKNMENKLFLPSMRWEPMTSKKSRPISLWDAMYEKAPASSKKTSGK